MARKLLSLVVALAVVMSSMSFAFAADPKAVSADVTDVKVKAAVEKLVALGMVEGIDGKYMPDLKLKRSELTKLIVIALGLGPAADAAKGATQFSDVSGDHWASGFISVAAGQGIVQGMGDGTFSPDSEITFAQALTMLVRALGYKDEFLPGTWPGNYLAKASEKDIYAGLSIVAGAAVKRGDFAIMMSNTLDAEVVKVSEFDGANVKYKEMENLTLAKDKLKLDKGEVRLTGNARLTGLKLDEVSGIWTKDSTDTEIKGKGEADASFNSLSLASGINSDLYMGSTCDIYVKDKDTIVYIAETGTSVVYWDGVDKFTGFDANAQALPNIKLRWSGKTYSVKGGDKEYANSDKSATIYLTESEDTDLWDAGFVSSFLDGEDYGRFVVENGKVVFADIYRYESTKDGLMVKSVDAEKSVITYIGTSASESILNIANSYTGGAKFYLSGKEIAMKDLKQYDVLYVSDSKVDSKNVANVFVFRKTKTGTLTSIILDDGDPDTVVLDSDDADMGDDVTYSNDNNETYKENVTTDVLNDFYGTKVTMVIDNEKKIRHIYGEAVTSAEMYGVVAKIMTEAEQVKVYTANDESVSYSFEDTDEVYENAAAFSTLKDNFTAALGANDYLLIRFKLNKDGKIAKKTVKTYQVDQSDMQTTVNKQVTGSFGSNTMNLGGSTYYATSDIKIFDLQTDGVGTDDVNTSNLNVSKWANFVNKEVNNSEAYVYVITDSTNEKDVEAMFIMIGMDSVTLDQKAAYLINTSYVDGKTYGNFAVYGSTGTQRFEITNDIPENIEEGAGGKEAAVIINVASSGKVELYEGAGTTTLDSTTDDVYANGKSEKLDFATVAGYVYKIDGNKLTIGMDSSSYKYEVASDAIIYSGDGDESFGKIDIGDMVIAVMKNGTIQAVELIDAKTSKMVTYGSASSMGYLDIDEDAIVDVSDGYYTSASPSGGVRVFGNAEGDVNAIVIP